MDNLSRLQSWYLSQCDENWEHSYGIKIGNLDNPGWTVEVDLIHTYLENSSFSSLQHGIDLGHEPKDNDWWVAKIENKKFMASCGPKHLDTVLGLF